jgi:hypothetical protein
VLTRRDYDRFDAKDPFIVTKLMTLFVEHRIVYHAQADGRCTESNARGDR